MPAHRPRYRLTRRGRAVATVAGTLVVAGVLCVLPGDPPLPNIDGRATVTQTPPGCGDNDDPCDDDTAPALCLDHIPPASQQLRGVAYLPASSPECQGYGR